MSQRFRVIFMGTTDFSEAILKKILSNPSLSIVGVVCQPDRPVGRKKILTSSPIKILSQENNIPVFQPEKISTIKDDLIKLESDLILTCAYGQFLPEEILQVPKLKALNVHASLLPLLRGGAPIQWSIINNLSETGITLMDMARRMDAGDTYSQSKVLIEPRETYQSLKQKLIISALELIDRDLFLILENKLKSVKQDESKVTFGLNITRKDELINFNQPVKLVDCHIRGLYNVPIAYTTVQGFVYKIHQAMISEIKSNKEPGTITQINKQGIFVATKDYDLIITEIQPASKNILSASDYHGFGDHKLNVSTKFQ